MKRNISNLWLLVFIVFLAMLAACAGRDAPPAGPTPAFSKVTPPKASFAPPSATPNNSNLGSKDASANPNLPTSPKLKFSDIVGKQAPDFTLESLSGESIKLSSYRGTNVILFINEGAMCYPACWEQMAQFGSDERFNNKDITVLSIVVNQKSEWERIVLRAPPLAKATILFDTTRAVSSAYDVLFLKSSMHPGTNPGHTYFIVDKEGIIRFAFDDPVMGIRNDMLADELKKLAP